MKLENLKILELASVLAGPTVGTFFAELGASVTKIENPLNGGDITRKWKLPNEDEEAHISAYYASANTGKTVQYLNFKDAKDRKKLNEKIKESDIIVVNFKPGDAKKFKLTFEDCKSANPTIIYAEVTGFGADSNRTAYDIILQAETGFLSMNGTQESMAKLPVAFIDLFAAHQLKEGILVALLNEQKPAKVSVSLFDAAISSLANQATNQLMNDHTPKRIGILHPNIAPYGEVVTCNDGVQYTLAIGTNKQFVNLMNLLQIPNSDEFETNALRVTHRKKLFKLIQHQVATLNSKEFESACLSEHVPVGKIRNLKEVFELPSAQQLVINEDAEGQETQKVKTTIFTISS